MDFVGVLDGAKAWIGGYQAAKGKWRWTDGSEFKNDSYDIGTSRYIKRGFVSFASLAFCLCFTNNLFTRTI